MKIKKDMNLEFDVWFDVEEFANIIKSLPEEYDVGRNWEDKPGIWVDNHIHTLFVVKKALTEPKINIYLDDFISKKGPYVVFEFPSRTSRQLFWDWYEQQIDFSQWLINLFKKYLKNIAEGII